MRLAVLDTSVGVRSELDGSKTLLDGPGEVASGTNEVVEGSGVAVRVAALVSPLRLILQLRGAAGEVDVDRRLASAVLGRVVVLHGKEGVGRRT
jgi:hypothetical protein